MLVVVLALGVLLWLATLLPRVSRPPATVVPVPVATPAPMPPAYSSAFVRSGARWTQADRARLSKLAASITGDRAFPSGTGVELLDPRSSRPLYERNARLPLVPASAIKLVVAAVALRELGPSYRFSTTLVSDGVQTGDTLTGNLWLVGRGDPELSSADVRGAVRELARRGLRRIEGNAYVDGSAFGPDLPNQTWDADDLPYDYAALPSAVSVDGAAAELTISPTSPGAAAQVKVDTPGTISLSRVKGGVRTASRYADNTVRIDVDDSAGDNLVLSGQIPYGAPQQFRRSLPHPTQSAAEAFVAMLAQARIAGSGPPSLAQAPSTATVLWEHRSAPLRDVIHRMAFESDNHVAEQLLRVVGLRAYGLGTLANGIASEHRFLQGLGAEDRGTVIADGSGLSPANRLTAATLCDVLRAMLSGGDAYLNAHILPRVGAEGTVKVRELDPDAQGRILGKDGYIGGASSLAGYALTAHHGVVIYAFMVNDWERGLDAVWRAENRLLSELSRF